MLFQKCVCVRVHTKGSFRVFFLDLVSVGLGEEHVSRETTLGSIGILLVSLAGHLGGFVGGFLGHFAGTRNNDDDEYNYKSFTSDGQVDLQHDQRAGG